MKFFNKKIQNPVKIVVHAMFMYALVCNGMIRGMKIYEVVCYGMRFQCYGMIFQCYGMSIQCFRMRIWCSAMLWCCKKYASTDCTGYAFCSTFYKTGYKEYYQRVYRPVYYCCTGYILVNNQCVRKFPTFTNVPVHY